METITILITPFWQGFVAGGLSVVTVLALVMITVGANLRAKKSTFAENVRKN